MNLTRQNNGEDIADEFGSPSLWYKQDKNFSPILRVQIVLDIDSDVGEMPRQDFDGREGQSFEKIAGDSVLSRTFLGLRS